MENQRPVNRFITLALNYTTNVLEAVVDHERWFQGTGKTWGQYSEPSFGDLSCLDRYIILKGIFAARAYESRPRRLLLKYFDECKTLLGDLDMNGPMYSYMQDIVRSMYNNIYLALYIGQGVRGTFEANGYVWSPTFFPHGTEGMLLDTKLVDGVATMTLISEAQNLTNRAIIVFLMCVAKRYRHCKGMNDFGRELINPYVQFGKVKRMMVYRNGLDLGENPGSMLCSEFDYKLLTVEETTG